MGKPKIGKRRIDLTPGDVLLDAWHLYRIFFRRSILTAAIVLAPYTLFSISGAVSAKTLSSYWPIDVLLTVAGPALVQGALILVVHDLHSGTHPRGTLQMLRGAIVRFLTLLAAAALYTFGIIFGLMALVVPGLMAAARWCLMIPFVMIERCSVFEARRRSSQSVRGVTRETLKPLILVFVVSTLIPGTLIVTARALFDLSDTHGFLFHYVVGVLTTPFYAHTLNVLYYRIVERRPVLPDGTTN